MDILFKIYDAVRQNFPVVGKSCNARFWAPKGLVIAPRLWAERKKMNELFEQMMYNTRKLNTTVFPFYNLSKEGDKYTIDLALSGYGIDDIKITVDGNSLQIESDGIDDSREYIFRGYTGKSFVRRFTLQDDMVVRTAEMINGVLKIILEHVIPESKKPREIRINIPQPHASAHRQLLNEDSDI